MGTYLEACEFFLSFREPREFDETVESFLVNERAPCTPYRTNDRGFIATLKMFASENIVKCCVTFGINYDDTLRIPTDTIE